MNESELVLNLNLNISVTLNELLKLSKSQFPTYL